MKSIVLILFLSVVNLNAMSYWQALSQLESGDNDKAIGQHFEVSRYQILREYWPPGLDWENPQVALYVARDIIMKERVDRFVLHNNHQPTAREWVRLWHGREDRGYEDRFINLLNRKP